MARHQPGRRTQSPQEKILMQKMHNLSNDVSMSDDLLTIASNGNGKFDMDLTNYISKLENKIDFLTELIGIDIADRHPDIILKYPEYFLKD